jgi:arylsulfatase A-like enzyme
MLVVLLGAVKLWRGGGRATRMKMALGAGAAALASVVIALPSSPAPLAPSSQPNVILIGLDSLRHDLIDPQTSPKVTPAISEFFTGATWFADAITPLARTFPSMTALLTGHQPHDTGAYMNLLPRDMIKEGDTLGRIFQRAGYRSIYATDEVRFSNIDQSYGFDQVITPPIGSSEFLISMLADTPVSNLVVNTTLGRVLFPHVHANRGAAKTYDPDTFNARVEREAALTQPFFLTTHLTLAHWPYTWADAPLTKKDQARWPAYYLNVAARADAQFASLLAWLEESGALANAIVVVYSDHGEAFGRPGESLAPEKDSLLASLGALPFWGHGVSVLSPHQYKVVLGIRGYGAMAGRIPPGKTVSEPVTLMDVAPTLVELTGTASGSAFSGHSLLRLMRGDAADRALFVNRVRFTETEYAPINIATQDGKLSSSAVADATRIYHIDPRTDRLEVKRDRTQHLLRIRQYAALGDKLLLAAIPRRVEGTAQLTGGPSHSFLVIDRRGGLPGRLTKIPDQDSPPELRQLWYAMYAQFGAVLPPPDSVGDVAVVAVADKGH